MLLSHEDAEIFFKLHRSLMHFVNQRLGVVPNIASPEEFATLPVDLRVKVGKAFLDEVDLIESFVDENPANLSVEETEIVLSWRDLIAGKFYVFRQLKKYMVFLSMDEPSIAYGVVALTEPFEELIGPNLPVMIETVLLPFKDRLIYDGILSGYGISFGGGIKRMLNESYRSAKDRQGIVASLPIESPPISPAKTNSRKPRKAGGSGSKNVKPALEAILELTNTICLEHLNEEYAELCRELAEKLSRKRPSPLLRGKPKTWACGILRTIGWVNFLDDRASKPHVKMTAIDKLLGVAQSTGQGKSKEIRKMLRIRPFDMDWTLPSRMDDNLMGWMIEVDGFAMDARNMSRDIQEIAFEKGLIPYIPADRAANPAEKNVRQKTNSESGLIYQFKITLLESPPAIWRRIQVVDCTLDKLHEYIQSAMGWTNSHLYQFEIDGMRFGNPEMLDDGFGDVECIDSTNTRLSDLVPKDGEGFRFLYEYDFGDGWEHEVLFEGCPPRGLSEEYPLCIEGERACPPEDVGGAWGYQEFLAALANPNHEQHEELLEWHGPFDSEAFDVAATTQMMREGLPSWS